MQGRGEGRNGGEREECVGGEEVIGEDEKD